MKPTDIPALGLMLALSLGGLPNRPVGQSGRLVVAQLPAGEMAEGVPVREFVDPPENAAAEQAEHDADAQVPGVRQPGVARPDVVQPPDQAAPGIND
jgi:hypothetical protein